MSYTDVLVLIDHTVDEEVLIIWLTKIPPAAATFVQDRLRAGAGQGTDIAGNPKGFSASGTDQIYAGAEAATFFGAAPGDPRVPDIYATTQPGTVYTGGTSKIAEHGGVTPADRPVPLIVAGPGIEHRDDPTEVATTQIAPTILTRLHLDPPKLQAVVAEDTATRSGL